MKNENKEDDGDGSNLRAALLTRFFVPFVSRHHPLSSNESWIAVSLSDLSTEMTPNFQYLDVFSYFFHVIKHKYKIAM